MDVVVTHLGATSALLLNETETANHWLQLQLVGTESERDAIGVKIKVRLGDRELSEWVIAGDGYLCRNEAVVAFGLGELTRVDEISISWPSGKTQTMQNIQADRRWLIIEGQGEPFELSSLNDR